MDQTIRGTFDIVPNRVADNYKKISPTTKQISFWKSLWLASFYHIDFESMSEEVEC